MGKSAIFAARRTLAFSVCLLLCAIAAPRAGSAADERTLSFYNIHTKETLTVTYKKDGKYVSDAMKQINHIMRDWRRNEPTEMDPELIDIVWQLHTDLGSKEPVHLVSGYRSATTNERMRRAGGGQAKFSQHVVGKAADIHFPDVDVKTLRNSALVMKAGGVGYYPTSGLPFVHVDTGNVRHWPRIPDQEMAAIMREGRTQVAAARTKAREDDGKQDTRVAMADENEKKKLDSLVDKAVADKDISRKVVMASFVPDSLPWKKKREDSDVTASIPKDKRPAGLAAAIDRKVTAALEANARAHEAEAAPKAPVTPGAAIPEADAVEQALEDYEHPEELSHEPFVFRMVSAPDIGAYDAIAAMAPPAFVKTADLMTAPALQLAGSFGGDTAVPAIAVARAHLKDPAGRLIASGGDSPRHASMSGGYSSAGSTASGLGFAR
ncbi:MAG: DUF882 domain-containing protein [Hyphomicrobiales bacterium]